MTTPDDPLPEQTRDDTDLGWGTDPGDEEDERLRQLLDDRPPHHLDRD